MRSARRTPLGALALGFGAAYLAWRIGFSLRGAPAGLAWPALAVEVAGFVSLALLLAALRAGPGRAGALPPSAPDVAAATLVVVRVEADRTVDDVRASLLSVGPGVETVVVDRSGRDEVAAAAARLGARYERTDDPLGLPATPPDTADWVAVLDAGDVVRADGFSLLAAVATSNGALGVGVVQGLVRSVADDSAEHDAAGRDERAFERGGLNAALGARGAAVWTGSGAVFTREAFDTLVALPARRRRSELEASVALRVAGHRLVAPTDRAVVAQRPVNRAANVRARRRREVAAARRLLLSTRNPAVAPGLVWRQRVGLLAWCAPLLSGHRRAAFVGVVAASLVAGTLPFSPDALALVALWLPFTVLSAAAVAVASGGLVRPGDRTRRSLRLLGASVGRAGRPMRLDSAETRGGVEATGDRVLLGALAVVAAAAVARTVADIGDTSAVLPPAELAGLFGVALWLVALGLDVLRLLARRSQRRAARRVPVGLAATVNGERLVLADLTPRGAGFVADGPLAFRDRVELHVVLPRVHGPGSAVVLRGVVRNRRVVDGRRARVGVSFTELDAAAHDALLEHCAVAFPIRLLDRDMLAAPAADERYVPAPAVAGRAGGVAPRLVGLATVACVVTSLVPNLTVGASAASPTGDITVIAFHDHNANGARDVAGDATHPAIDGPVEGVGITATCLAVDGLTDTAPVSGWTDATGRVTLTGLAGSPCRIEVVGTPPDYQPAPLGVDNGGFVQFAATGTTVRVGLAVPGEFCQDNPTIAAACYTFGDQVDGAHAGFAALKTFPLTASGSAYDGSATDVPGSLAEAREIGTTFGAAWHRATRTIFVSAMTKVYAGYGPGGTGAVYAVDADGAGASLFATIPNAGTLPARAGFAPSGTSVGGDWLADGQHWDAVGTTSLGDIELSKDEATLWVVNLHDRSLYPVDVATGAVGAPAPVPLGTGATVPCDPAWVRPFGLGREDTEILVGSVCAGPDADDLRAYVYGFEPSLAAFTTTPVFEAALTYAHGQPGNWCGPGARGDWNAWTSTNLFDGSSSPTDCAHPQPMLTDIELDDDGSLILAFRDRFGDQSGEDVPPGPNGGGGEGVSAGDLLRACPSVGGWALEANGSCGGVAGAAVGSGEGPGGGEFYSDNFAQPTGFGGNHQEVTIGGLAKVPGLPSVLVTAFDPSTTNASDWRAGGVRTSDNRTGTVERFFNVFDKCESSGWDCPPGRGSELTFGKVNGLGDLVALCDAAPVEIGDRVWFDADADGLQDAGEPNLPGVTVTVEIDADDDGSVDTTTQATTNAQGRWVVSSDARPPAERAGFGAADDYGVADLKPGARVVVIAPTSVPYAGQTVVLTTADAAAAGIDSDAATDTGRTASFVIAGAGMNDHTWDVGYTPYVPPSTTTTSSSTSSTSTSTSSTSTSSTSTPPTPPSSTPRIPDASTSVETTPPSTAAPTSVAVSTATTTATTLATTTTSGPDTESAGATNRSGFTSLPRTGAGVLSATVIALALVLAGSVLVGAASGRRRRRL